MNKKLISAAVLLGLSSAATAVNIGQDGVGSVLLFPYYTAHNGKFTNIQIVNTQNETKAVKVRLNEGVNTWEVLDFNLYLSPYDVWTAAVYKDGDKVYIKTEDNSCTNPLLTTQELRTYLMEDFSVAHKDPKGDRIADGMDGYKQRLLEGHMEVFEMGNIDDAQLEAAILHGSNGQPADCSMVRNEWGPGKKWTKTSPNGNVVTAPTGGLFGSVDLVDVPNGSAITYDATAIQDFYQNPSHAYPGSSFPNVAGWRNENGVLIDADRESNVFYNNQVITTEWGTPADALSAVLMREAVMNTYSSDESIPLATDWVISFPTRHAYVNQDSAIAYNYDYGQLGFLLPGQTGATKGVAPFASGFTMPITLEVWDREEQSEEIQIDFSPSRVSSQSISYEVNVLEFSETKSVFDSYLGNNFASPYKHGWAKLTFTGSSLTSPIQANGQEHTFSGRPVIGFSALEVQGAVNNGTLANYAGLYNHKYQRNITIS